MSAVGHGRSLLADLVSTSLHEKQPARGRAKWGIVQQCIIAHNWSSLYHENINSKAMFSLGRHLRPYAGKEQNCVALSGRQGNYEEESETSDLDKWLRMKRKDILIDHLAIRLSVSL